MKKLIIIFVILFVILAFGKTYKMLYPPVLKKIYKVQPNLKKGEIGILTDEEKNKAITQLNKIRKLHKLPPVQYTTSYEEQMNKGALIIAANGKITHNPQKNFKYYSEKGAWGCYNGNLYIEKHTLLSFKTKHLRLSRTNIKKVIKTLNPEIASAENIINTFLIDEKVSDVGHRRWILNPFFYTTSYGRIDDYSIDDDYHFITAATLKVLNFYKKGDKPKAVNKTFPDFIAYPFENYPSNLFKRYWYMSFAAVFDKNDYWNNKKVNFKSASIKIIDEFGIEIKITNQKSDNNPAGLPNNLQWKAKDLKLNTKYFVTIDNIVINYKIKSYKYWFKIIK